MRRFRVLLDANVLVDAQVRDLFLTMAEAELIEVRWSSEILGEAERALVQRLHVDEERTHRLFVALTEAFMGACVEGFEHLIETLELPDSNDRHVLAAALHGECELLVTYNVKDFPEELPLSDLLVVSPDEALFMLAEQFRGRIGSVVWQQIARLKRPSLTPEAFLERLSGRAPRAAVALGAALGIEAYEQTFHDVILAEAQTSAHGAVRELLEAVEAGDQEVVHGLVAEEFTEELVGHGRPNVEAVYRSLERALRAVIATDGWGLVTGRRPHSPDVELVVMIRGGDEFLAARPEDVTESHVFEMRFTGDRWLLIGLDRPEATPPSESQLS